MVPLYKNEIWAPIMRSPPFLRWGSTGDYNIPPFPQSGSIHHRIRQRYTSQIPNKRDTTQQTGSFRPNVDKQGVARSRSGDSESVCENSGLAVRIHEDNVPLSDKVNQGNKIS